MQVMLTSKVKFILSFAVIALIFSNCDKDPNSNTQTTVAEDKANIRSIFDDIITEAETLKAGCGVQTVDKFLNIDQGNVLNSNWAETIYNALEAHLNLGYVSQTSQFNLLNHAGTHSWNPNTLSWTATSSPTDKAILQFPSEMNSGSNDATATVHHYTDEQVSFNSYQYWLPKTTLVDVAVNNQSCIGVELKSATYDNSSFQIPTTVELVLTLAPYTFEITANRLTPTKFNIKLKSKNGGTEKFALDVEVNLKHSNYETIRIYDDVTLITGSFTFGDFSFPLTADFETARALLNPSDNQINALFNADILYKGNRIGDLDYDSNNGNGTTSILINYKDGTAENTSIYYQDFIDRLELVLVEFTGAW